jgi:DNA-binding NarL/FixJ family response regulator
MTRILIADDHPLVRKGLKDILSGAMGKIEFGEAEDAQQTIAESRKSTWDLIVLDLSMPGKSGLDTLKQIRQINPKSPILVLSMHSESQFALRAIRAGASSYLSKDSDIEELLKAINAVLGGGKYISRTLAERIADHLDSNIQKPPHENLSDREFQILCMLASGKKLKDISKAMSLSIKTISICRQHILEKMNAKNNSELTQYSIQNRLIG